MRKRATRAEDTEKPLDQVTIRDGLAGLAGLALHLPQKKGAKGRVKSNHIASKVS
jgi:hypothetical protein